MHSSRQHIVPRHSRQFRKLPRIINQIEKSRPVRNPEVQFKGHALLHEQEIHIEELRNGKSQHTERLIAIPPLSTLTAGQTGPDQAPEQLACERSVQHTERIPRGRSLIFIFISTIPFVLLIAQSAGAVQLQHGPAFGRPTLF